MDKSRIKLLDETLVSKIAAGEVVERPFSVVKELVENSIDAGATQITVEVKNGGRDLIRVADNGCGMTKDEAKIALERHSTSKINTAEDLFNIRTLGFRGEALPSISSVSKLEILTRINSDGQTEGVQVLSEGGHVKEVNDFGCPAGTAITIKKLFYNMPARLKFMKSPNTELSHIINITSRFILSNPNVSIRLLNDGSEVFSSPGSGRLIDAVASVYGVDMVDSMLEIKKNEGSGIKVWGYISQPVITKSDRGEESFFVNGRYVRNMLLSRALEDSYRNLIPNNRYPIATVFIDIDPAKIDVNVHPTKREIKFERPDGVINAVKAASLNTLSSVTAAEIAPSSELLMEDRSTFVHQGGPAAENLAIFDKGIISPVSNREIPEIGRSLTALTQIADTYIIAVKDDELILVDQHAAHERILYERIKNKKISGSQKLLINLTIKFIGSDFALLEDNLDYLTELGFELEPFGKDTFIVRAIPSILEYNQAKEAVEDILSDLVGNLKIKDAVKRKDEVFKMLACKGAVKAGDRLSFDEMNNLIRDLLKTEFSTTCPHGRPTTFKLTPSDLEKIFKRK